MLDVDAPTSDGPQPLNVEQTAALARCTSFFHLWNENKLGSRAALAIPRILIHSGPGTGKSFFTRSLVGTANRHGLSVLCIAPTGIAAGILHFTAYFFTFLSKTQSLSNYFHDQCPMTNVDSCHGP